jgi:hypothetical protein
MRKELQRNAPAQLHILGFVNYSHTAAAEAVEDPIVGDDTSNHQQIISGETGDV